jgi:4-alpha-glucanotransferase
MSDGTHLSSRRRVAGVTIPLFSIRTARSWGIGEIGDLPDFAAWVATAGLTLVQILPLGEISGGETSPYSALSAFGIDPMYISLADVEDLPAERVREALGGDVGVATLEQARAAAGVDYGAVRFVKQRALRFAFERFRTEDLAKDTARAGSFGAFSDHNRHWLDDYALFRALKDAHGGVAWWDWPAPLRERRREALDAARAQLANAVAYYRYVQWLAHTQWETARGRLAESGVEIMGDLPFMVGRDSADVWANPREFRDGASVGVPPDQFNAEGQDWGLPPYHWEAMRADDFAWLRRRARYSGALYNRFRIDHLVGFYRTYMRPLDGRHDAAGHLVPGVFDPADERAQLPHGERVVTAMVDAARERGARLVAEDLGIIPNFVRPSLTRLGVPGYKVLIWEKDDAVFRDPRGYPAVSVACFGTHDTDPVATWWETRAPDERAAVTALPGLAPRAGELGEAFTPAVHRALLDLINGSASELVLLLMQDVLGTRERINTPATVGPHNWTYRLPAAVERLRADPDVQRLMATVRESVVASGR